MKHGKKIIIGLCLCVLPGHASSMELGAHVGMNAIVGKKAFTQRTPHNASPKTASFWDQSDKKGAVRRVSIGSVTTMPSGCVMGVHGFLGYMGGTLTTTGDVANKWSTELTMHPTLNTGLYGQLGVAFGGHRVFGVVGWALSRFKTSGSLCHDGVGDRTMTSSSVMWKNGIVFGAGYDLSIAANIRVGVGYMATVFPGKSTLSGWTMAKKHHTSFKGEAEKVKNDKIEMGRLLTNTLNLSVTLALGNGRTDG